MTLDDFKHGTATGNDPISRLARSALRHISETETGCWLYDGDRTRTIRLSSALRDRLGNQTISPRNAVILAIGNDVAELQFRHVATCGTAECVRPDHLKRSGPALSRVKPTPEGTNRAADTAALAAKLLSATAELLRSVTP